MSLIPHPNFYNTYSQISDKLRIVLNNNIEGIALPELPAQRPPICDITQPCWVNECDVNVLYNTYLGAVRTQFLSDTILRVYVENGDFLAVNPTPDVYWNNNIFVTLTQGVTNVENFLAIGTLPLQYFIEDKNLILISGKDLVKSLQNVCLGIDSFPVAKLPSYRKNEYSN